MEHGPSSSLLLSIPKYPQSIVLSFLTECNGATAALMTNRYLYKNVLPLFRRSALNSLKISPSSNGSELQNKQTNKNRHVFRPLKFQDPSQLLARLNTRRLRKRLRNNKRKHNELGSIQYPYPLNISTSEIAEYEWFQQKYLLEEEEADDDDNTQNFNSIHPVTHELHRFPTPIKSTFKKNDSNDSNTSNTSNAQTSFNFPTNEITLLASYPRCGNTLLRSLFEKLTCTVTGSDTRPDRTLALALSTQHDMTGEGVTNAPSSSYPNHHASFLNHANAYTNPPQHSSSSYGVHMVKTHFPERRGCRIFDAHRIILLTRNPYDALESYFHMALTNTHTESLTEQTFQKFLQTWEGLVKDEIQTWRDFHLYWLSLVRSSSSSSSSKSSKTTTTNSNVPLLVVRYEDLVRETREVMRRVLAFTMGKPLVQKRGEDGDGIGAFWERRLDLVLGKDKYSSLEQLGSYQPRSVHDGDSIHLNANRENKAQSSSSSSSTTIKIGKSLAKNRYSEKLLEHMNQISGELLRSFGYDVLNQGFPYYQTTIPRRDRVLLNVPISSTQVADEKQSNKIKSEKPFVRVNVGKEIRDPQSPYGRYMTTFRKTYTDNDTKPLPIVSKVIEQT